MHQAQDTSAQNQYEAADLKPGRREAGRGAVDANAAGLTKSGCRIFLRHPHRLQTSSTGAHSSVRRSGIVEHLWTQVDTVIGSSMRRKCLKVRASLLVRSRANCGPA